MSEATAKLGNSLEIISVDLTDDRHTMGLQRLLDDYSQNEFGNGRPLEPDVLSAVIPGLQASGNYLGYIAFSGDQPVGLVNCFVGFSTFRAKPLINVHDLCVHHQYRGQGVGRRLLSTVAQHAQDHGFCRVTLEVRSDNEIARGLYDSMKFQPGTPPGVTMEFLTKSISEAES